MIARREGGGWTLITQIDHSSSHCAELARSWRLGPEGAESVSPSLEYAAGYHDLGWIEADQQPEIDADGAPRNFTQVDEAKHTDFYSRAVRTIAKTDPYAAYLVSLHASGLYNRRYGWSGFKSMDWTAIGPHGRALLAGERALRASLLKELSPAQVEFEAAWRDYMLLETFDYLSLLTCFGLESSACGPVPTVEGQWTQITVRRLGPWDVELSPFPFPGDELVVGVESVHLDRARFSSSDDLRARIESAQKETRQTTYRRGSSIPTTAPA